MNPDSLKQMRKHKAAYLGKFHASGGPGVVTGTQSLLQEENPYNQTVDRASGKDEIEEDDDLMEIPSSSQKNGLRKRVTASERRQ